MNRSYPLRVYFLYINGIFSQRYANTLKINNYICSQTIRAFQANPHHTASQLGNLPNGYTQNSSFPYTAASPTQQLSLHSQPATAQTNRPGPRFAPLR
jgi:hypothetical protein